MVSLSLVPFLFIVIAVSILADPIVVSSINLPISRRLNLTSAQNLYRHDFARARSLKRRGDGSAAAEQESSISTSADNQAVTYVANVGIGSPPTQYALIIDTGSSNTWVGAGKAYVRTSSSRPTGDVVSVQYGSGSFQGLEYRDTVDLGNGLVIQRQSIGVASYASGFGAYDGILGIGPVGLTVGTLYPHVYSTVPTVTDNLFSTGTINHNTIGISFQPTSSLSETTGEITWGGTDSSKYTDSITFTDITTDYPASRYWGIDQSITYGAGTTILSQTAGIVDTGTTLLLIASDAFQTYQTVTGATLDSATGLATISATNYANLQSLLFTIADSVFEFTPNAQTWPRALNTAIGGSAGSVYLVVADIGSNSGSGLDFINGYTWLERFYSVYDTANSRIGIAKTPFTYSTDN